MAPESFITYHRDEEALTIIGHLMDSHNKHGHTLNDISFKLQELEETVTTVTTNSSGGTAVSGNENEVHVINATGDGFKVSNPLLYTDSATNALIVGYDSTNPSASGSDLKCRQVIADQNVKCVELYSGSGGAQSGYRTKIGNDIHLGAGIYESTWNGNGSISAFYYDIYNGTRQSQPEIKIARLSNVTKGQAGHHTFQIGPHSTNGDVKFIVDLYNNASNTRGEIARVAIGKEPLADTPFTVGSLHVLELTSTAHQVIIGGSTTNNKYFTFSETGKLGLGNSQDYESYGQVLTSGGTGTPTWESVNSLLIDESQHVSGSITHSDTVVDIYNKWESDTQYKGAILTLSDNSYDPGAQVYTKTVRAAIKGGTSSTGTDTSGYLAMHTSDGTGNEAREVARFTSEGKFGLGTDPGLKLHVNSGSINECARFESSDTEVTIELKDTTGTASLKCRNDFRFNNSTNGELVRITTDGKVGIGEVTPDTILHITSSDFGGPQVKMGNGTDYSFINFDGTSLQLSTQRDMVNGNWSNTAKSWGGITIQGPSTGSSILFYTSPTNNTNPSQRMIIDSQGFVGIGTTGTISNQLHVGGSILATSDIDTEGHILLSSFGNSIKMDAGLQTGPVELYLENRDNINPGIRIKATYARMRDNGGGDTSIFDANKLTSRSVVTDQAQLDLIRHKTGESTGGAQIIFNNTTIGATGASSKKLLIQGGGGTSSSLEYGIEMEETFIQGRQRRPGMGIEWGASLHLQYIGNHLYFNYQGFSGANFFAGGSSSSDLVLTGTGGPSDDRLKFGEVSLGAVLPLVAQIQVKRYQKASHIMTSEEEAAFERGENGFANRVSRDRFEKFDHIEEIGVIAQELHSILPTAVTVGDEEKVWKVKYNQLACIAIKAIQELTARVEQLETQITNGPTVINSDVINTN